MNLTTSTISVISFEIIKVISPIESIHGRSETQDNHVSRVIVSRETQSVVCRVVKHWDISNVRIELTRSTTSPRLDGISLATSCPSIMSHLQWEVRIIFSRNSLTYLSLWYNNYWKYYCQKQNFSHLLF